jgi:hypothetical protein
VEASPGSIGTADIGFAPRQPDGGIIFSSSTAGAWGRRDALIYGSLAAVFVLVVVAGWLLTGNS